MKKYLKIGLIFIGLTLSIVTANSCLAASSLVDTSNPNYASGNYSLNDIRDYAVYIMKLILSLVGTISLIAFVYGGITFLTSAGSSSQVSKGVEILKAAVIGLIITFASVLIINLFFSGLGVTWNQTTGVVTSK